MKVLLCHNFYRLPGGEDHVYRDEGWLLEQNGHEVVRYERHNNTIDEFSKRDVAKSTVWSRRSYREITELIKQHRPDIAHFHNTFPLISASGCYAANRAGVPVVQTLHNFRIICPAATLLRDGAICEKCINKTFALPSVLHKCYRDSRAVTAVTAVSNAYHTIRGTWRKRVQRFIALTNHSRDKFIASGWAPEKVIVKPNFVRPDPGVIPSNGSTAVFVGRLSPEKGIETLLAAWRQLPLDVPLKIIGDGPLSDQVLQAQQNCPNITWAGQIPFDQVLQEIGQARVLICPSVWYETFGRSMVEAFATGTPVIASNIGSMNEIVEDGRTGLKFRVGDPADLSEKVMKIFDDQAFFHKACQAAREEFEKKYTASKNHEMLMDIYSQASEELARTRRR